MSLSWLPKSMRAPVGALVAGMALAVGTIAWADARTNGRVAPLEREIAALRETVARTDRNVRFLICALYPQKCEPEP